MPDPIIALPGDPAPNVVAPRQMEVGVTQRTEDLTGNPTFDAWIKVTKYLGFPIVMAGAASWVIYLVLGDYRESIKKGDASQEMTAKAVVEIKESSVKNAMSQDSQTRAMWEQARALNEMKTGIVTGQDINKDNGQKLDRLADIMEKNVVELQKAATVLEAAVPPVKTPVKKKTP